MAITISGTNGIVGAGFTVDNSGVSVTAGVGTFGTLAAPAAGLTGALPALSAASLTSIPAANLVGVCTSGLTKTGGFGKILQIVQNTATTREALSSSTFVATVNSITITPTAASSKILIQFNGDVNTEASSRPVFLDIYRSIDGGTFAGIAPVGSAQSVGANNNNGFTGELRGSDSRIQINFTINYLDTPSYSVGNAIVYKIYARSNGDQIEIPSNPNAQPIVMLLTEISA